MDSSANARLEILYRQCYPSLYRYALWPCGTTTRRRRRYRRPFSLPCPRQRR